MDNGHRGDSGGFIDYIQHTTGLSTNQLMEAIQMNREKSRKIVEISARKNKYLKIYDRATVIEILKPKIQFLHVPDIILNVYI